MDMQYRLASSGLVNTPGVLRWAINGYHFPKDRKAMARVFIEGWGIPEAAAHALLSGKAPYTVEKNGVVVFEHGEQA
jgi:hypothetical protein